MKRETDYILIQRIRECRPASVNILFRGGEPALAGPEFFRYFTEGVKQYITSPVPYGLQSNGTLIDNSYTKFFLDYIISNFQLLIPASRSQKPSSHF